MDFVWVTRKELGTCPAAVDMDCGIVEINRDEWGKYDEFQRRFIIAHEEGHYKMSTDNESEADVYAIRKVAGTAPKSLARSIETLFKVGIVDDNRYENLYREALIIDYEMGNEQALIELEKLNNMNEFKKKTFKRNRMDGTESDDRKVEPGRSHRTNGLVIGDFYFSFTNIALIAIFFLLVSMKGKM